MTELLVNDILEDDNFITDLALGHNIFFINKILNFLISYTCKFYFLDFRNLTFPYIQILT